MKTFSIYFRIQIFDTNPMVLQATQTNFTEHFIHFVTYGDNDEYSCKSFAIADILMYEEKPS